MITSKKSEDGIVNLSFNIKGLDSYLQEKSKVLKGDEIINFQTEIMMISHFTMLVHHHLQSIRLFYMLEDKDESSFLSSLDALYHQFLRNLLMNDKDYDKLLDALTNLKKVINKDFENLEI